jgi:transposase
MYHEKMRYLYVGVDSHKETHYAVVLNCFAEKLGEIEFRNAPSIFPEFLENIKKYLTPELSFLFGFEDISDYGVSIINYLISQGYTVKHVNSSLVAVERKSINTLHKTDSFDSECAARVLINKFDTLSTVKPNGNYMMLNLLVSKRNYFIKNVANLKKELHRLVSKNYPSYKKYFSKIDNVSALNFFEKYPSPQMLDNVTQEDIIGVFPLLMPNKISTSKIILETYKSDGDTKTAYQDTTDFIITSLIRQLRSVQNEIVLLEEKISHVIDTFPQKLQSIRGINTIHAAALLAEIGDITNFKSPSKLARYAGIAPVTFSSGKTMLQFANERGNRRLNSIFFLIAVTLCNVTGRHQKLMNPIFYKYYHKKISEGKTKKQAIKCVQRRLVNIIWNMLKHNTEYINPESEPAPKEELKGTNKKHSENEKQKQEKDKKK